MKQWIQKRSLTEALIIGGLATIVLIYVMTYGTTRYFLSRSDAANTLRWSVDKTHDRFQEARIAERDFFLTDLRSPAFYEQGQSGNLAKHEALMASVSQGLERLGGVAGDRQQAIITQAPALLKAYEDGFLKLVAVYREKGYRDWGIEGEWRKAIHDVEQHLPKQTYGALQVDYLRLRRDEKDYLLRGDDAYVEGVRADVKRLATDIKASHNAASAQLLEDVNRYERLFQKYRAIEEQVGKTAETGMRGDAARAALEPFLDEISSQAAADSEAARRNVTAAGAIVAVMGTGVSGLFFYVFATSMVGPIKKLGEAVASVRQGNLSTRMHIESQNELGLLAGGFNNMVGALASLVGQVQESGRQVNASVTEIAAAAREQQASASEIATTTTEIGATSREISATSKKLVDTMNDVAAAAEQSTVLAGQGQDGLTHMGETMRRVMDAARSINAKLAVLSDKAGNISQVVTTITKIADQTNVLSLNAAIEAAKAGEYGRGFGVVATEMRRHADQTAVATYEIDHIVKEIQSAVVAGVMGMDKFSEEVRVGIEDVQRVGDQLSQVIQQVQALAPRVEAVNNGMHAQANGAEQITQALTQLSEAAQHTVDSLRQSNQAIDELDRVAIGLRGGISRFTLQAA